MAELSPAEKAAINLAAWMANPNQIDHLNGDSSAWSFDDFNKKKGTSTIHQAGRSKSQQSISSWNSFARSYVVFSAISSADHAGDSNKQLRAVLPVGLTGKSVITGVNNLPVRAFKTRSHGTRQEIQMRERNADHTQFMMFLQSGFLKLKINPKFDDTFLDVAPLLRLKTLMASIDLNCYKSDLTASQFIRGAIPFNHEIVLVPRRAPVDSYNILAIKRNDFFRLLTGDMVGEGSLEQFQLSDMDVSWVAIFIDFDVPDKSTLVPYVASFLSNGLYAGTVNVLYDVDYKDPETGDFVCSSKQINIPAANSCSIPGPRNGLIVFQSKFDSLEMNGFDIPIWRSENKNVEVLDFADIWSKWFTTENLNNVLRRTSDAITALASNSVLNANDMANAMAAEVYPAWRPGLCVPAAGRGPDTSHQWNKPSCGGYGFTSTTSGKETVALAADSPVKLKAITPNEMADPEWRKRMEGFNFASTSANMLCPSGLVAAKYVASDTYKWGGVVWAEEEPTNVVAQYNVPVCKSIVRFWGFDRFKKCSYEPFDPVWNHMLACALSANTACFLITNDMPMKYWSGFAEYTACLSSFAESVMEAVYDGKLITHKLVPEMNETISRLYQQSISRYYRIDPVNSLDWAINCPVPMVFTLQWADKLEMTTKKKPNLRFFRYDSVLHGGFPVPAGEGLSKIHLSATIDVAYGARQVFLQSHPKSHVYGIWLDAFATLSSTVGAKPSQVMTTTPTYKMKHFATEDGDRLYVVFGLCNAIHFKEEQFITSSILYPAIKSYSNIVESAKPYVNEQTIQYCFGIPCG